jgi:hypothetical protein
MSPDLNLRAAIPIKKGVAAIIATGLHHTICSDLTRGVDDNSEGVRIISLFGVPPLEPAPFAKPPALLVVGNGYSVTGPMGGSFFQVIPVARTASAKSG